MATKSVSCLFPVRDRKSELSESKFSCPFPKNNGEKCKVSQKFRNLKNHCRHMHGSEISIRCMLQQCRWRCHISLRCLTSHRDNLENHGVLTLSGCEDLDSTCMIVPYVKEDHGKLSEHTAECAVAKYALKRYSGKILKRADRARAQAAVKQKEAVVVKVTNQKHAVPEITLEECVTPTSVVVISLSPSKNLKAEAWKTKRLAAWKQKTLANYVACWEVELAKDAVSSRASKNSGFPPKNKTSTTSGLKRKNTPKESELPLKKRLSTRDIEETVVAEPAAAGAAPIVEDVTNSRAKSVKGKPIMSSRKFNIASLRAKLSQMKTDGMNHIEWKDFDALLQTHNLQKVRSLVQLGSGEDQVKVAEQK